MAALSSLQHVNEHERAQTLAFLAGTVETQPFAAFMEIFRQLNP
jgi:hypothetical protein